MSKMTRHTHKRKIEKKKKMENQKYSGEVNLDHAVIDRQDDGTVRMYFHDLPPILLKCPIIITPEEDDVDPPDDPSPDDLDPR